MPFKSLKQQAYLFAKHPDVAKEFAEHTPKSTYKKLPEYVSGAKNKLKHYPKNKGRRSHGKERTQYET